MLFFLARDTLKMCVATCPSYRTRQPSKHQALSRQMLHNVAEHYRTNAGPVRRLTSLVSLLVVPIPEETLQDTAEFSGHDTQSQFFFSKKDHQTMKIKRDKR